MPHPLVSVVMPAYNHEKYVSKAIDSVLQQSYSNFEFIIVNDGSSDGTELVIKKYNDKRITYFAQENRGAHNALNRGIGSANGKYISIINSDDIYHRERLSENVEYINENNSVFVFTDLRFIDSNGNETESNSGWLRRLQLKHIEGCSLLETFLSANLACTSSNFFFLKGIVEKIGCFSPYRYVHDYDFILKALLEFPERVSYHSEKKSLYYRIHGENTIKESVSEHNKEAIKLFLGIIKKIKNDDSLLNAALANIDSRNELIANEVKHLSREIKGTESSVSLQLTEYLSHILKKFLEVIK